MHDSSERTKQLSCILLPQYTQLFLAFSLFELEIIQCDNQYSKSQLYYQAIALLPKPVKDCEIVNLQFYIRSQPLQLNVNLIYFKHQISIWNTEKMQLSQQLIQNFEAIPEESSFIETQNQIPNIAQSNSSFQLLLKAYERIRSLQQQNEELNRQLIQMQAKSIRNSQLQREIHRLNEELKEKDARIQNLQKISEKAIMEYVKIERELQLSRIESCQIRKNATAVPSQVSSPLHPTVSNQQQRLSFGLIKAKSPKNPRNQDPRQLFHQKQRLFVNLKDQNCQHRGAQFTFDGGNRCTNEGKKVLKNCFSTAEMTNLVKKVHFRQQNTLNDQRNRLKQYKNYCSNMERKYSPTLSVKKEKLQSSNHLTFSKKYYGSPKNLQLRPSTSFNQKYFNSANTTTSMSGGFFKKSQ